MAAIIDRVLSPQRKRTFDAINLREPDRVPVAFMGHGRGIPKSPPWPGHGTQ